MKSIIILNDESYFLTTFLDEFLANTKHDVVHIFTVDFFPPQANKKEYTKASLAIMPRMFIFRYILKSTIQFLTNLIPFSCSLNKRSNLMRTCKFHNVAHKKIVDVNDPEFITFIKENNISVALSICSQIYRKEILSLPNFELYNFHPSLLPRNKGRFPIFWAFMRGDPQGLTCHRIVEKIDAGEIICQRVIETLPGDDVETMLNKVTENSPSFFEEAFDRILQRNPQKDLVPGQSFYGPTPTSSEIEQYHRIIKGNRYGQGKNQL